LAIGAPLMVSCLEQQVIVTTGNRGLFVMGNGSLNATHEHED
jgi:hypothetical protein